MMNAARFDRFQPATPGFNGEVTDPLTGHYLLGNGYRAYNPVLMRFNSPDHLSPFGEGGLNTYGYCKGNPVNRIDPDGHTPKLIKNALRRIGVMKPSTTRIVELEAGLFMFEDIYKNKKTVTFLGHGLPERVTEAKTLQAHGYDETASAAISDRFSYHPLTTRSSIITPEDLFIKSQQAGIDFNRYEQVHLLVCFSGAGPYPFSRQFSDLTGKPVLGYPQVVASEQPTLLIASKSKKIREVAKNTYLYQGKIRPLPPIPSRR